IERKKSLEVTAQALELELAPVLALVGAQPKQEAQPGAVAVCDLCRIDHELARRVLVDPAHRIPPDAACGLDVEATGKAQAERPLRTSLEDKRGVRRRADGCVRGAGSHREVLPGQAAGEVGEPYGRRKAGFGDRAVLEEAPHPTPGTVRPAPAPAISSAKRGQREVQPRASAADAA